jgi:hypothetical protein
MKLHTTNYKNTFITVAPDCPADAGLTPRVKTGGKSVAEWQYELLSAQPHVYTSDELMFEVHCARLGLSPAKRAAQRDALWQTLFGKPMACLRASPLPKTYGWGVHFDADGRITLVGRETPDYERYLKDKSLTVLTAMRSKK